MKRILLLTLLITCSLWGTSQQAKNVKAKQVFTPSGSTTKQFGFQQTLQRCYTVEMEKKLQEKYPDRLSEEDFEKHFHGHLEKMKSARTQSEELYQIQTIVHVVHNGESVGQGANISNAQVMSQFQVLNEDFRRLAGTPGFNDHPDGADILIEFVPATVDPEGNPLVEPGIHRYNGGQSSWNGDGVEGTLKPDTYWDPERYFNIWVANFGGDLGDVLGYAQFPSLSGLDGMPEDGGLASTDGVIMRHQAFGTTGSVVDPFDGGRTTTHEVGHWLGLRHIWGDGGCSVDDYCEDTPRAADANYGCPSGTDSCTDNPGVDMIENYMDYTDDACMNIFTNDQKTRMRTVMQVSPRRKNLALPPCDEGSVASLGSNSVTPPQWFSYTASAAGVYSISSVGQTTENTFLSVYGACNTVQIADVDDAYGTSQSEFQVYLEAEETMNIFWSGRNSQETFNWTLASLGDVSGGACDVANEAIEGTNELASTTLQTVWYSFTQPEALSKITIDGGDDAYTIYSGSCDQLRREFQGTGTAVLDNIELGEDIFVAFEAEGTSLSWTLDVDALTAGEACVTAVEAVEGTNNTTSTPYWFTYTMTDYGRLNISSTGQTAVATSAKVYDACGGNLLTENVASGSQTDITLELGPDDEVKILWEDVAEGAFDWTLTETPYEPGEICEVPLTAAEGNNSAPSANLWYSFTMPITGSLQISSVGLTTTDTYLVVLSDCEGTILGFNDDDDLANEVYQSELFLIDLNEGQEVYIYWSELYSNAAFDWSLTVVESYTGEKCENPREAIVGVNEVPEVPGDFFWVTYTVPESGKKLSITGETEDYVYVIIDECGPINEMAQNIVFSGAGRAISTELEAGDELKILWDLENGGGYEWELKWEDYGDGDACALAQPALLGTNSSAYAPQWFTYTMPKTGDITVSSASLTTEDTYLELYTDCESAPSAESDDINYDGGNYQSRATLTNVAAGSEVLIYWVGQWSAEPFDWRITLSNLVNNVPAMNPQSFFVPADVMNDDVIGTVVATDADDDPITFSIAGGNQQGVFAIDSETGEIRVVNAAIIDRDYSLTITVTDGFSSRNALMTIDVAFPLSADWQKEIVIYPNPVQNGILKIDGGEFMRWNQGDIVDMTGRILLHIEADQREVNVSTLQDGLYFIRLETTAGSLVRRIMVE